MYMACDAELINQIATTYFDNFVDRIPFVDIQTDTMFGRSLLLLCGDEWHQMRSILSPAFTGSKIRNVFGFVVEAADKFTKSLSAKSQQDGSPIRWEMSELFSHYSVEIVASFLFGLEINSMENPSDGFLVHGKRGADFSGLKIGLRITLLAMFPRLMQAIDYEFVPQRVRKFFKSILVRSIKERTSKQIFRPDILNTLMEMRRERQKMDTNHGLDDSYNDTKHHWTDDELAAQCFSLFILGFDTIATAMTFMAYELSVNPDIQQKLYDEIRSVDESLDGGQLTFDDLAKLEYLDQVIHETLRKYPTASFTTRQCTKDVELDLGDGKRVSIERGVGIWISFACIHNDPRYFENPSKFDPERFSKENKHKIKSGSYLAFGIGPRNCIGECISFQ